MSEEEEREEEEEEGADRRPIQRRLLSLAEDGSLRRRAQAVIDLRRVTADRRFAWQERGPWTLAAKLGHQEWMGSRPVAGLVMDVAVDGDVLVVGTAEGGVWMSTDGGDFWRSLTDRLPALTTGAVAMTTTPDGRRVIMVGTSDSDIGVSSPARCGIYRSVDGGATWIVADGGEGATAFTKRDVNWIRMVDERRLFVATDVGLFWSADGGHHFGSDDNAMNGEPIKTGVICDLKLDSDGATTSALFAIYGGGIWRVTVPATGTPRSPSSVHEARATVSSGGVGNIVFDHARPEFLEIWVMNVAAPYAREGQHHSVQLSNGDGSRWTALSRKNIMPLAPVGRESPQTSYDLVAALDPRYHGGFDDFAGLVGAVDLLSVRMDVDGDNNLHVNPLTELPQIGHGTLHDDQHVVAFDRTHGTPIGGHAASRAYVGNDGGLYRSDNPHVVGAVWDSRNGMRTTLFFSLAVAARPAPLGVPAGAYGSHGYFLAGGLQDNGTAFTSTRPGMGLWELDWVQAGGADGSGAAILPIDAAAGEARDCVVFLWENDYLRRLTHRPPPVAAGALEWTESPPLLTPPKGIGWTGLLAPARGADGLMSVMFAAHGSGTSFFGTVEGSLHVARNCLAAAEPAFERLEEFGHLITALAVAPRDVAVERGAAPRAWSDVWVGLADGSVRFSPNSGHGFMSRSPGPERPVAGIAVDPQNSARVAVCLGNYGHTVPKYPTGSVWLTEDHGEHWHDISGTAGHPETNLPDAPALGIAFTNTTPPHIIVATEVGVLATADDGRTWNRLGTNFPGVAAYAVCAVEDRRAPATVELPPVLVATYGRGIWEVGRITGNYYDLEYDGGFGQVRTTTTAERTFRVVNDGIAPFHIVRITPPTGVFTFVGAPAAGTAVPPGGDAHWIVRCAPTAAGTVLATAAIEIDIVSAIDGTNQVMNASFSVEGVATGIPRLATEPKYFVALGPIPSGAAARDTTLTLTNSGTAVLHITEIEVRGASDDPDPFVQVGNRTTPFDLQPGEQRILTVTMDPSHALWPGVERTIRIHTNDPTGEGVREVLVTGGKSAPGWLIPVVIIGFVGLCATGYLLTRRT